MRVAHSRYVPLLHASGGFFFAMRGMGYLLRLAAQRDVPLLHASGGFFFAMRGMGYLLRLAAQRDVPLLHASGGFFFEMRGMGYLLRLAAQRDVPLLHASGGFFFALPKKEPKKARTQKTRFAQTVLSSVPLRTDTLSERESCSKRHAQSDMLGLPHLRTAENSH